METKSESKMNLHYPQIVELIMSEKVLFIDSSFHFVCEN